MPPISMEVCAAVLSIVLSNTKVSSGVVQQQQQQQEHPSQVAAILLLCHWLAVAPYLMPMVLEFWQILSNDPWPQLFTGSILPIQSDDVNNNIEKQWKVFVVAEALFELCSFFHLRQKIVGIHPLT
jgi:hypothetical protein